MVAQIFALDAEGLSQRKIARRLGICKTSVFRVLAGEHCQPPEALGLEPVGPLSRGERLVNPPRQCRPGCGHMIYVEPCRICRAKRLAAAHVNPFPAVVDCPRCGRQPARLNETQVRCGHCGEFIRRRDGGTE